MYIIIDKDTEEWKRLKAYDIVDNYEISNYGNIRKRNSENNLSVFICIDGYKRVNLKVISGGKQTFLVHRLVAFTFVKGYDIKNGKILVNHLDSIRSHSYYENLEWATYAENIRHGYEHGRLLQYNMRLKPIVKKFDDNTIHSICKYLEKGYSASDIYKLLGSDQYTKKIYLI